MIKISKVSLYQSHMVAIQRKKSCNWHIFMEMQYENESTHE